MSCARFHHHKAFLQSLKAVFMQGNTGHTALILSQQGMSQVALKAMVDPCSIPYLLFTGRQDWANLSCQTDHQVSLDSTAQPVYRDHARLWLILSLWYQTTLLWLIGISDFQGFVFPLTCVLLSGSHSAAYNPASTAA